MRMNMNTLAVIVDGELASWGILKKINCPEIADLSREAQMMIDRSGNWRRFPFVISI